MSRLLNLLRPLDGAQRIFLLFALLLVAGGAGVILAGSPVALLPAAIILAGTLLALEWRILYYLFLLTLAFSHEISLPGGMSMDIPSEPLMLLILANVGLALLRQPDALSRRELLHPLVLILGVGYLWAITATLFSVDTLKSVKYLLAKIWYIGPFLFGTLLLLRKPQEVWRISGFYAISICITVIYTMIRHSTRGFTFDSINWALEPFYSNHVIYATVLVTLLPYTLYGLRTAWATRRRWVWGGATLLLFLALLVTYTRASLLSVPVAALYYLIIRFRLTRLVLVGAVVAITSGVFYLLHNNTYLRFAPKAETVFNGQDFGKHLEATYKLEDMSGMERVYRWVAAGFMIADKPLIGSGPSTFYPEYKRHTVWRFHTYVSRNPEKSTTHNYFLMITAEQGVPGLFFFLLLISTALLLCERLYHRSANQQHRHIVLASGLSLVIIVFHLLLNEVLEVDKIGPFFFIALAILIRMQTWTEPTEATQNKTGVLTS